MTLTAQFENVEGKVSEMFSFIKELDAELGELISKLEDATQNDALDICREVSTRLDKFYQQL